MKRQLIIGTGILLIPICLAASKRKSDIAAVVLSNTENNSKPSTMTTKKRSLKTKPTRSRRKVGGAASLTNPSQIVCKN